MSKHPTTSVPAPGDGRPIEIDVELAPLIAGLWRRDVATSQSCQEYRPGFAWIAFPDAQASIDFLTALGLTHEQIGERDWDYDVPFRFDADSLPYRALNPEVVSPSSGLEGWMWHWSALPDPDEGVVAVAVEFPRSDLPELIRRVDTDWRSARG